MKNASLKFNIRMRYANIMRNNIEAQKIILKVMLSTIGALAILYIFILGNMVFNIVQRGALEKQALSLSNDVGNLELSYLSLYNSVDLAFSSSMGFKETHINFATRKSLGSLRLDNNEI